MFFAPKWKKNARLLNKGAGKFIAYKRDLLTTERIAEIESRRDDLRSALRAKDRAKVDEATKQLRASCEGALPREKAQSGFEENVEVMFVAIVIALGLRAYYLQPFRIPTGSMQPTLNGIIGTQIKKEDWPGLPKRALEYILRGRSYHKIVNDQDRRIALESNGQRPDIRDSQFLHFFSRSQLYFQDSKPLRLPAPTNPAVEIGLGRAIQNAAANGGVLKKGEVIIEGMVDSGDLVLVDKFSYHFRKPERGEVFVFDTLGIRGIAEHSGPQGGGSHYIKRLVGVPGDSVSIETPDLLIDGKIAEEPKIRRVATGGEPFQPNHRGYVLAQPSSTLNRYLVANGDVMSLKAETSQTGMREYAAMGDNTGNSLDSRYWGTVKEFNLVGPAMFALWPVTTGHWGFIR